MREFNCVIGYSWSKVHNAEFSPEEMRLQKTEFQYYQGINCVKSAERKLISDYEHPHIYLHLEIKFASFEDILYKHL